jgi:hypothetical protein
MMLIMVVTVLLVVTPLARAGESSGLTEHEAPRATDLLRAKRLAEKAQDRLRTPHSSRAGWAHGGEGWNAPGRPTAQEPRVTINVGSSRQPKAKRSTSVD